MVVWKSLKYSPAKGQGGSSRTPPPVGGVISNKCINTEWIHLRGKKPPGFFGYKKQPCWPSQGIIACNSGWLQCQWGFHISCSSGGNGFSSCETGNLVHCIEAGTKSWANVLNGKQSNIFWNTALWGKKANNNYESYHLQLFFVSQK